MSTDLPDPTPVNEETEPFSYRPPRLRITATYDNAGTGRPTSLEVEIHDDEAPDPEILRQVISDVAGVLTHLGSLPTPGPLPATYTQATNTHIAGAANAYIREAAA